MSYLSFCVYIHLLVFVLIKVLVIFTANFTQNKLIKMKTIFLSIAVALLSVTANAQNKSTEIPFDKGTMSIFAGYGLPNVVNNLDGYTGIGPLEIGYQYHLSKKVSIGLIYTYSHFSSPTFTFTDIDANTGNTLTSEYAYDVTYTTFLARFDYFWKNSKKSAIYSGLAVGYVDVSSNMAILTDGGNTTSIVAFSAASSSVAFHLTAIGIKYKAFGNLGGFAELGYGCNGIVNLGLQYSFGGNSKSKK